MDEHGVGDASEGSERSGVGEVPNATTKGASGGVRVRHAYGLTFRLLREPDGAAWLEVLGEGERVVTLERVGSDAPDLDRVADRWIARRLAEVPEVDRCVECGLAVDLHPPHPARRGKPRATEFEIWGAARHDDECQFTRVVVCTACQHDLAMRHPWLRDALPLRVNPRRLR